MEFWSSTNTKSGMLRVTASHMAHASCHTSFTAVLTPFLPPFSLLHCWLYLCCCAVGFGFLFGHVAPLHCFDQLMLGNRQRHRIQPFLFCYCIVPFINGGSETAARHFLLSLRYSNLSPRGWRGTCSRFKKATVQAGTIFKWWQAVVAASPWLCGTIEAR